MIYCPHCKARHWTEGVSMTTAMGWVEEYINGVPQNSNPNITTTECICCECGHKFHYSTQHGKIISLVDDGEMPKVPILDVPLTVPSGAESATMRAEDVLIKSSWNDETTITIPTSKDLDEIKHEIVELREEFSALKDVIIDVFSQKM